VVDVTDVNLLCEFLLKILKIHHVGQMTESTIYEIMYPYCRVDILALVPNGMTAIWGGGVEIILARLVGNI